MIRRSVHLTSLAIALVALIAQARPAFAQVTLPIRMRTFAVNMSTNLTGANAVIEITLDQWSSAEERQRLLQTVPKGQDALVKALEKVTVKGRMRIPAWQGPDPQNYRLGWDLKYAWHEPLPDGGERIVIATTRYMSFAELRNQPRTVDYPFTLIEIHLPKEGKGQGKMAAFTQISFDKKKNVMEIENYGSEPVRLNEITVEKK